MDGKDAAQLNALGVQLMLEARPAGDIEALASGLELLRAAVAATDGRDPHRPGYLTDLCAGCVDVFNWNRQVEILAEGIAAGRAALAATPAGHPDATRRLSGLGDCLRLYAEATRNLVALAEAIDVCRRAIKAAAADDPDLGAFLANLANSLYTRYEFTADLPSLAESVSIGRRAVEVTAGGNPDAGMCLSNLAIYLEAVFDEYDNVAALREAADVARRAVDACDPGHDEHAIALANLSGTLQKLADRTGTVAELTEAVAVARRAVARTEDDHPDRAARLSTLAVALHCLAARTGAADADSEALDIARQAVDVMPAGHPEETRYQANLAAILRARFERYSDPADLEESVAINRRALSPGLAGDARLMAAVSGNFGNDLEQHFRQVGDPELLDQAVRAAREAAGAPGSGRVSRTRHQANLAILLQVSFETTGELDDLLEANDLARQAVAATAEDDPALARQLNILMCGTQRLAIRTGDPTALAEAADAGRRAVATGAEDAPERPGHLANLSITLQLAFERTGQRALLAEALETGRMAVAASTRLGPGDRSVLLSGLSLALSAAYDRTGDAGTLDEAVRLSRQALEVGGGITFYRPGYLSNLGLLLRAWHTQTGEPAVLREAADVSRQAADALPEGHPDRGLYLSNLGSCLRDLAGADGEPGLMAEAARVGRAAVLETPPEHPDAARFLFNLGTTLVALFRSTGDHQAAQDARDAYRDAAASRSAAPSVRVMAARQWGVAAMLVGDPQDAVTAFEQAIGLLPQIAPRRLARADREFGLHLVDRLASEAAASAVASGHPGRAVELLEQARGVLLAESIDNRGDLAGLRQQVPELAARLTEIRDQLDQLDDPLAPLPALTGPWARAGASLTRQQLSDRRELLQEQWDRLLARIRALPRFRDFLRPLSIARLSQQASAGPVVMVYATQWRSGALALTGDRDDPVVLVEMPKLTEQAIYAQVNGFLAALTQAKSGSYAQRRKARSALHDHLETLWRSIAQPVLKALRLTGPPPAADQAPRIWWCPVGVLAYLPLHAAGEHRDGGLNTVLDLAVSSYTATVRLLEHSRRPAGEPQRPASTGGHPLIIAMPETPGASPLDGVPAETAGVHAIAGKTIVLEGERATNPAVCAALGRYPVAHFACHGISDWSNPSDSRLLLHDHLDHPFTVTTVSGLQLQHAELAYLSACSTNMVAPHLTDEAVHLVSAFQIAGFRQVIGTLWTVDMSGSTQVALDVYRRLAQSGALRPEQAARALHAAVRQARDRHRADPVMWAAYVHAGV